MRVIVLLIIIVFINSCKDENSNESAGFNLHRDITDFSKKMANDDTLIIYASIGACTQRHDEVNIITKINGITYLSSSFIESGDAGENKGELGTKIYIFKSNDTLNFEHFFTYLKKKEAEGFQQHTNDDPDIIVKYKGQELTYFSDGLVDHLMNAHYYTLIKCRIYPEAKIYQPTILPKMIEFIPPKLKTESADSSEKDSEILD